MTHWQGSRAGKDRGDRRDALRERGNVVGVLSRRARLLAQWGRQGRDRASSEATGCVDDQGLVYVADYVGAACRLRVQFDR